MSDPITIGAGIGAGVQVLRGKSPLKGALMGGIGGAGYGALTGSGWAGNLLSKGGLLNTSNVANAGASVVPGSIESSGMVLNPATGTYMNPEYFAGTGTTNPIYTGAGGVGSKIWEGAKTVGGDIKDYASNFATENPNATQAATQVALQNMLQPQPQYQVNPPAGPSALPSKQSATQYTPTGLMSQVQRNQIPEYQRLYGF